MRAQLSLFSAPPTVKCPYGCGGKAELGPERYNAARTCMNQSARCLTCGKAVEFSHNLTLRKGAA